MIQCDQCEYFNRSPDGRIAFGCDPFSTIKEPECLAKWQLLRSSELTQRMDRLVAAYEATLKIYQRLQPMQEKMFRHMEREIDETEEGDAWKYGDAEGEEDDENESPY
ncbi:MAG: hypothetical protein ACE5EQ_02630 [Phycisphaerae bacterium]